MALSWALHDVSPSSLLPGDHVYRWSSLVHVHHGIVLQTPDDKKDPFGTVQVLHIPSDSGIECRQETLGTFLGMKNKNGGGSLKSARYGVPPFEVWIKRSGTCYAEQSGSVNEVLARANSLLQKSEQHCVFRAFRGATSEDIAFWCKTGKSQSAAPNNIGGTNYEQASQPRHDSAAATAPDQAMPSPQARSSDEDDKEHQCKDPDAFLLLQDSNEAQQLPTPQNACRTEVLANDADLEEYEVVDLPPWLPAEHYPAVVNAQA